MRCVITALPILVLLTAAASAKYNYSTHPGAAEPILSAEPAHMQFRDTVLVNDGTCPAGQMKKVTGGWPARGLPRQKECVAH